jgi:hypothetical protein
MDPGVPELLYRGELLAFAGHHCRSLAVDGRETVFAAGEVSEIGWAPVPPERRVPGGAMLQARVTGRGEVRLPAAGLSAGAALIAEGAAPGSRGQPVPCRRGGDALVFEVDAATSGRWLYAVPRL